MWVVSGAFWLWIAWGLFRLWQAFDGAPDWAKSLAYAALGVAFLIGLPAWTAAKATGEMSTELRRLSRLQQEQTEELSRLRRSIMDLELRDFAERR